MNLIRSVITFQDILAIALSQKVYSECFVESDDYIWQSGGTKFTQKYELEAGFTRDMQMITFGWCDINSDKLTLNLKGSDLPIQSLTLETDTGFSSGNNCARFKPS